ncbi:hypothetical protein GCM10011499_26970 [Pelagibacterium lentulum]|uniref:Uncharacterized protein n=2 Tax=Pelagibacterium lentulum TaxID=2029865 RepID=A0A916RIY6_9HYPH|nr:hypothetical protein [Pelagibacterium lentulum]GGA55399.1 hypothetical protein GCM10011499_26970 [Pelagibacterium lentulum]
MADDPCGVRAKTVMQRLSTELEIYWRGMRDGQAAEARLRYEAAQKRARQVGLTYKTVFDLTDDPN